MVWQVKKTDELQISVGAINGLGDYFLSVISAPLTRLSVDSLATIEKYTRLVMAQNAKSGAFYLPLYGLVSVSSLYPTLEKQFKAGKTTRQLIKDFCADMRSELETLQEVVGQVKALAENDESLFSSPKLSHVESVSLLNFQAVCEARYILHLCAREKIKPTPAQQRDLELATRGLYALARFDKPTLQTGISPSRHKEIMRGSGSPYAHFQMIGMLAQGIRDVPRPSNSILYLG